jgi:guanylate kinase
VNKLIIVTAPSGAGKTTIVHHLLQTFPKLAFSVSATNRARRSHEKDKVDYYFFTTEKFKKLVTKGDFLEYEEVYTDQFYGTLKKEVKRLWELDKCIVFDVDVKGATSLIKAFKETGRQEVKSTNPVSCLSIFIKPPSKEILFERLRNRKTETPESLKKRIDRATEELTYEDTFDYVLVNDQLDIALEEARNLVGLFLNT